MLYYTNFRFMREIQNLKRLADYSSRDSTNLNSFLQSIGPEFSMYTYSMLNAGVDKESIRYTQIITHRRSYYNFSLFN